MAVFSPRYRRAAASHLLASAAEASAAATECDRQHMWDERALRGHDPVSPPLHCLG